MIIVRRSADRHHVRRRQRDVWSTFHPEVAGGFETLVALNEGLIPPGESIPSLPFQDAEVITYVLEGALACKGSAGGVGVTDAGEFQCRGAVGGHRESNASRSTWARVFQIWLRSSAVGLQPSPETKRFPIAQRRGVLCLIASHDGRGGSLRIQSDAQVHSAVLDSGRHVAYELAPESRAWVHVVTGEVRLGGDVLTTGDGAGITAEHAVSLVAADDSEILLVGLGGPRVGASVTGSA
jgi:redox-sensitive bicupin YhaK (pirin superfamily)